MSAAVPGGALALSARDLVAAASDLWWARVVLEVAAELGREVLGGAGEADVVHGSRELLRVSCHANFAGRVPAPEQYLESVITTRSEAFVFGCQEPPRLVRRIVPAALMPLRVVLAPPAELVDEPVREVNQMERIRHLHCVGKYRVEHAAV